MARRRSKAIPKVPITGKAAHNAAFLTSIGSLVVNWANNESVFLAMLQLFLVGGKNSAAIVWQSLRTSNARLELVDRLCRERVKDTELLSEITEAISHFRGLSRIRNFYCHATYRYDSELNLDSVSSVTSPQEGHPLVSKTKRMDRATLNEIGHASIELMKFNRRLWVIVERLQIELGAHHVTLPILPPEPK